VEAEWKQSGSQRPEVEAALQPTGPPSLAGAGAPASLHIILCGVTFHAAVVRCAMTPTPKKMTISRTTKSPPSSNPGGWAGEGPPDLPLEQFAPNLNS